MSDGVNARYKLGRVMASYGLTGLEGELAERWSGEAGERESLRELAHYFNRRVLRAAMERAGANPLDGEVENTYRLLTADDTDSGMRTQARMSLEREGLDVDALERDFVSHQAVHTYLTKHLDLSGPSDDDETRIAKAEDQIMRLKGRMNTITEEKIRRLADAGAIDVGKFDVLVDVRVLCEDCGRQYDPGELLERRGCECDR